MCEIHVVMYWAQCKLRGKVLPKHLERKGHRFTRTINPCSGRICTPGSIVEEVDKMRKCPECDADELTYELRREARQDQGQEHQDIRKMNNMFYRNGP